MRPAAFTLVAVLLLWTAPLFGDGEIGPLQWNLPEGGMWNYTVVTLAGGKPVAGSERAWSAFAVELNVPKEHQIAVVRYRDLPFHVLFLLPQETVKPGQVWNYERTFWERGLTAVPAGIPGLGGQRLNSVVIKGQFRFKGMDKVGDQEVALIEGSFNICQHKRGAAGATLGTLKTAQYLALDGPRLLRARYDLAAKSEEMHGVFSAVTAQINVAEQLDLVATDRPLTAEGMAKGIDEAITRGVAWLKAQPKKDGSFKDQKGRGSNDCPVGTTALALMALLHSGVKPEDPVILKGFESIRTGYKNSTYEAALVIQAIETKYLPMEKIEDVKNYNEEETKKALKEKITAADRATIEDAANWLIAKMGRSGSWGYPDFNDLGLDHSNTQYAVLGLKSAARCGVKIDAEVWKKVVRHFLENQITTGDPHVELKLVMEDDAESGTAAIGGIDVSPRPWGYGVIALKPMETGYASMTCAGLTSIIVCESELFAQGKLDKTMTSDLLKSKREGLAFLQQHFSPRASLPGSGFWSCFYHYYLYAVERVGVMYGIKRIGGHDWYLEGARVLLDTQEKDGRWVGEEYFEISDTAFALLFLKRGTLRVLTK